MWQFTPFEPRNSCRMKILLITACRMRALRVNPAKPMILRILGFGGYTTAPKFPFRNNCVRASALITYYLLVITYYLLLITTRYLLITSYELDRKSTRLNS